MRKVSFLRSSRLIKAAALAAVATICGTDLLQDAVANGDTRTLTLHHVHSGESATVTFKRNGRYDPAALQQLNVLLQDWRRKEPTKMDPALFDIVWEVYRDAGATQPIEVIGGYRSPATNAMLRARSRGVAQTSLHMQGKAMDFYIPGVPLAKIREAGLRLQRGGVGFYPTSGSPFVHLDTGGIRHWPRMTRDQLARVFPDGKTVHVPADGKPMSGYATALAQVGARGNRPGGAGAAFASASSGSRKNIFAALFSKDSDDDEENAAPQAGAAMSASADEEAPTSAPAQTAAPAQAAPAQVAAAQPAPAVSAAANIPLPVRNPMGRSPEAAAALAAAPTQAIAVPLPMARPGEAPVRPAAPTTLAAADIPANGAAIAAANPAAAAAHAPAQPQNGGFPAVIVHGTDSATGGPTLAYASAGDFVVARPSPGRANEPAALPPGVRSATAPAPHSAATQAEIRRLFSSPTVARDTTLRTPELRRFGAFVAPPRHVVAAGFGRDASNGLATTRFTGAAVVAIPVVASAHIPGAPVESAPALPKRAKKLSMAGTGTTDNLPPPPH